MTSRERAEKFYYFWTGSTWTPGIGETPAQWMTRVQEHRTYIIARLAVSFDAHAEEAVADAAGLAARILRREPEADGTYAHLLECSGSRQHPPGTPGVCCCCLPGHAAEAVAAEREACARLAEQWGLWPLATAIRHDQMPRPARTPKPIRCAGGCGRPVPPEELARADPWQPIWSYEWRCPGCGPTRAWGRARVTPPADAGTPPSPP